MKRNIKKCVALYIALTTFLFSGCNIKLKTNELISTEAAKTAPSDTNKISEEEIDDTIRITISAAGDCTLGSDTNFGTYSTLDSELKNQNYDYSYFLKNVKHIFENDDVTVLNLEGPISAMGKRADKKYAFRGDPYYVNILTSSSVEAVNLSNNHTMDYGEEAFNDTKKIMKENGIIPFGGNTTEIVTKNGIKIGLIGVNTLTYIETANFISELEKLKEKEPDIIIANFHWGEELQTTANETQINLAHKAIDNGVDLVLGHHPHVLQGIEKYNGKYIVYSLGNFCFGGNRNPVDKDTMIFRQTFSFKDNELLDEDNVCIIPCSVSSVKERNNYQPTPLFGEEFEKVKSKIIERSKGFSGIENVNFSNK